MRVLGWVGGGGLGGVGLGLLRLAGWHGAAVEERRGQPGQGSAALLARKAEPCAEQRQWQQLGSRSRAAVVAHAGCQRVTWEARPGQSCSSQSSILAGLLRICRRAQGAMLSALCATLCCPDPAPCPAAGARGP